MLPVDHPHVRFGIRLQVLEMIGSSTVNYFDGYITDVTAIPQNGTYWTTEVNAADIFGRMVSTTNLQGYLLEEMLLDSTPVSLNPFQEAEGATSFGDISGNTNPAVTIANSKYGPGVVDAGQSPSGSGLPIFTVVEMYTNSAYGTWTSGHSAGSYLSCPLPVCSTSTYTIELLAQTLTTPPAAGAMILYTNDPVMDIQLSITSAGVYNLNVPTDGAGGQSGTVNICDGNVHQFAIVCNNTSFELFVDGVFSGIALTSIGASFTFPVGQILLGMSVIGSTPENPLSAGFAYLGVYTSSLNGFGAMPSNRILSHYTAGTTAFAGERTDLRVARILSYRANTGSVLDTGLGYVGSGDCAGETQQQALLDTSFAEGGTIYANGSGQIVFRNRANNFNPTPVLTLDASLGQVDVPSTFRDDVQLVLNDVTVSRPNGSDQRAFNQASINQQGDITNQVTANVDTDQHALDLANWMVGQGIQDQLGIPTLTVDVYAILHNGYTTLATSVLQLRPLDVVSAINLPGVSPGSTMTVQVQGGTYTRTSESLSISLFCTPMPPPVAAWDVGTWDSAQWAY